MLAKIQSDGRSRAAGEQGPSIEFGGVNFDYIPIRVEDVDLREARRGMRLQAELSSGSSASSRYPRRRSSATVFR